MDRLGHVLYNASKIIQQRAYLWFPQTLLSYGLYYRVRRTCHMPRSRPWEPGFCLIEK